MEIRGERARETGGRRGSSRSWIVTACVVAVVGAGCVDGVALAGEEHDAGPDAADERTDDVLPDDGGTEIAPPTDTGDGASEVEPPADADGGDDVACTARDAGTTTGWGTCEDLAALVVEAPVVTDDSGDGRVSPGEGADIRVVLRETAGLDFMWYPGVAFSSDDPRVTVGSADWRYGMSACSAEEFHTRLSVPVGIPAGSVVTVTARAAMLPDECPAANSLDIPVTIR